MLQKISEGEGARERELNSTEFLACDISEQNKGLLFCLYCKVNFLRLACLFKQNWGKLLKCCVSGGFWMTKESLSSDTFDSQFDPQK